MTTSLSATGPREAAWWALRLDERIELARQGVGDEGDEGATLQRLRPWARAFAGGDVDALLRRLSWDAWTPQVAAAVWAATPASLERDRPWIAVCERVRARAMELVDHPRRVEALRERVGNAPYLELWLPWLAEADSTLEDLFDREGSAILPAARNDLLRHLLRDLRELGELAAHELFAKRRLAGESYREFVESEWQVDRLAREYPVLGRALAERLLQWQGSVSQLHARFLADRAGLRQRFGLPAASAIAGIEAGVSDRHADGREVLFLELDRGERLVYKPRDAGLEERLGGFFDHCRELGLGCAPPSYEVWNREGYAWQEWVAARPLAHPAEAGNYFRSAGSLAAFAYVLRAQDLHAENLVATRRGPVVVDAEMFLQPLAVRIVSDEAGPRHPGLESTCLASGLLSQLEWREGGELIDRGGLREIETRVVENGLRRWHDLGTDSIDFEVEDLEVAAGRNVARSAEGPLRAEAFVREILEGFESTYRFLLAHRQDLLADEGPLAAFAQAEVRVLFRRSQDYAQLLRLKRRPRNQHSGLVSALLHEAALTVFAERDQRPWLWSLVADERLCLDRGDIPRFALPAAGRVLVSETGAEVAGYFSRSGLEAAKDRLERLSEADLHRQLDLARRCLLPPPRLEVWDRKAVRSEAGGEEPTFEESCLEVARGIGEELVALMARDLPHVDATLGEGRMGAALFWAALARITGEKEYGERVAELVGDLRQRPEEAAGRVSSPGGFAGLGSLLYGLAWIGRWLEDESYGEGAARMAASLDREALADHPVADVEGGAAGALLGALCLAETQGGGPGESLAGLCAEELQRRQRAMAGGGGAWPDSRGIALTGFAHGAAGMVRALEAWGAIAGDDAAGEAAERGKSWERSTFDARRKNWPVFTFDSRRREPLRSWRLGWCHGAPGVALGRLFSPRRGPAEDAEIEAALAATSVPMPFSADHLCCGILGRSSVLLTAAQRLGSSRHLAMSRRLLRESLRRARLRGDFVYSPVPLENLRSRTGFLKGLAGIGYHLLRSSRASELPDVLAMELPSEVAQRSHERNRR